MPQETHTKPTHAAGMVCCRDLEPFGNCFSTPPTTTALAYLPAHEGQYGTCGSHTRECLVRHVRMEPTSKV
jgi:hypothetical protein